MSGHSTLEAHTELSTSWLRGHGLIRRDGRARKVLTSYLRPVPPWLGPATDLGQLVHAGREHADVIDVRCSGERVCTKCGRTLHVLAFSVNVSNRDNLNTMCRECERAAQAARRSGGMSPLDARDRFTMWPPWAVIET